MPVSSGRTGVVSSLLPFPVPGFFVRCWRTDLLNVTFRPTLAVLLFTAFQIYGESAVHDLTADLEMVSEGISCGHSLNP